MNELKPRVSAPDDSAPDDSAPGREPPPSGTGRRRPRAGRGERKAVLNVTISESLAEDVRRAAALGNTTISSVVERALAEQISWEIVRLEGLAAIDDYYRKHGYPTEEEMAEADAQVAEEERLIDEARAALAAQRLGRSSRSGKSGSRRAM